MPKRKPLPQHELDLFMSMAQRAMVQDAKPKWDLRKQCTPKQLEFILDPAPQRVALCGRQAGKTTVCCIDLIDTCLRIPNASCIYIALTRETAKKIIWKDLKLFDREMGFGCNFREQELVMDFPNGSSISLSGCVTKDDIEKFRGNRNHLVVIDEAGSFPPFLEELVIDVLSPTLLRHRGRLSMLGTPRPVPAGFFFEAAEEGKRGFKRFHWTLADNPHVLAGDTPAQVFDAKRKERGLPPGGSGDDARFKREYFGTWVCDRYSRAFQWDDSNHFEDDEVPWDDLRCVIGVDTGHEHKDAIAVLGWSPTDPEHRLFLVEEWVREGEDRGFEPIAKRLRKMAERWRCENEIYIDPAAGGSKFAIDASRIHGVTLRVATKPDKEAYLDLVNDDLRSGRLRIRKDTIQKRSIAAADAMQAYWDRSRARARIVGIHSDIWDAILYAHRRCSHWRPTEVMARRRPICPMCGVTDCRHAVSILGEDPQREMREFAALDQQKRSRPWWMQHR